MAQKPARHKKTDTSVAWRSFFIPYIPSANDLLANGDLPKGKCFATRGAIDLVPMCATRDQYLVV